MLHSHAEFSQHGKDMTNWCRAATTALLDNIAPNKLIEYYLDFNKFGLLLDGEESISTLVHANAVAWIIAFEMGVFPSISSKSVASQL